MGSKHQHKLFSKRLCFALALLILPAAGAATDNAATENAGTRVRARHVNIHFQLEGAGGDTIVELWYSRDRGATWEQYTQSVGRVGDSAIRFVAPAEGLYGLILVARDGDALSRPLPQPNDQPERWVFIDYTPPLAQWTDISPLPPADAGSVMPAVQMRWSAYDNNFPSRPISLHYHSSVDQNWKPIESSLTNVGQYDWVLPENLCGQITFKLTVRDLGGHVVERLYGPVPLEKLWHSSLGKPPCADKMRQQPPLATQPAPSQEDEKKPVKILAAEERKQADELVQRGLNHLKRGEYSLAAERLLEATEINPDLLTAWHQLGRIYYKQLDLPKAIEMYEQVLKIDGRNRSAMLDAALAYSTARQYPQSQKLLRQMLEIDPNDAEAWLDMGDVLFRMGNLQSAREHWTKAGQVDREAERIIREAQKRLKTFTPMAMSAQQGNAGDGSR